jgi:hypothetical protein
MKKGCRATRMKLYQNNTCDQVINWSKTKLSLRFILEDNININFFRHSYIRSDIFSRLQIFHSCSEASLESQIIQMLVVWWPARLFDRWSVLGLCLLNTILLGWSLFSYIIFTHVIQLISLISNSHLFSWIRSIKKDSNLAEKKSSL